MADSPARPRRHNRANWVALRTLRQVPRVVDETAAGEPIYEIRSVRLVLPPDASHFARLVPCSKCRREVLGPVVLSPADLDHTAHRVICKDCVRAATGPMLDVGRRTPAIPGPHGPPPTVVDGEGSGEVARARPEDGRLAALEEWAKALHVTVDRLAKEQEERYRSPQVDAARVEALEHRIDEAVARLEARVASQSAEVRAVVDDAVAPLRGAVDHEAGRAAAAIADAAVRGDQYDQVFAAIDQRLERLQSDLDAANARSMHDELARLEQQLNDRLERGAERAARLAESGSARLEGLEAQVEEHASQLDAVLPRALQETNQRLDGLQAAVDAAAARSSSDSDLVERIREDVASGSERVDALEGQVKEAVDRLTSTVEEHSAELRNAVPTALEEMRSVISSISSRSAARFEAIEEQAGQRQVELKELAQLQAALDEGLGELRSGIAELREAIGALAARHDEIDSRVIASPADVRPAPSLRGFGRRWAEADAQLAAVSTATDDLLRERQRMKAQLADLEHATDQATAASARASARASELAPLRTDVSVLRDELLEQKEALQSLRKSVERLSRKTVAPPAEAKPAKRTTKR